ncbi:MAG: anthranilate phosphoribosyltransferase [Planctomycetaceae bacterium]|nr:anthranilate phosphoribosyltransferase [Planctomycetaceae bacterium]
MIETAIGNLAAGSDLTRETMTETISLIMQGACRPEEIGLFLTGLAMKGETVAEIAGAAAALRRHMRPIQSSRTGLVDTCGTGGDASRTFNVSTAAAIVTAAAGVPVAKHGNRAATSVSGSADVLAELGVNIEAELECVEACLEELGLCFCFAPLWHASMKQVAEVRRGLGIRTIFNLLGPLTNPAGAPFQLLGVGDNTLRPKLAEALALLGTEGAFVVTGSDGLDEVTLAGETYVTQVGSGAPAELVWQPEDFGIARLSLDPIRISSAAESAARIRAVLAGERGPARDIVVLNAAAAILVARSASEPAAAAQRAAEAIDSGAARDILDRLARLTHCD